MLLPNNHYTVSIDLGDSNISASFISKLTPYYCSVSEVLRDVGEFIQDVSLQRVASCIYDNSVYADEMAVVDFDRDAPPYHIRQFVRYKTGYDLVFSTHLGYLRSDAGRFQLGDLNIEEGAGMVDRLKRAFAHIKDQLKIWQDALMGHHRRGYAGSGYTTKSGSRQYPPGLGARW